MVKAIRVHEPGSAEVLQYEDIELPPPGEGQVQIRHRAIGVNFIDTYFRIGMYPSPGGLPFGAVPQPASAAAQATSPATTSQDSTGPRQSSPTKGQRLCSR